MRLTVKTFKNMIKNLRAIYGQSWRSDLDNDKEAQLIFFQTCQELIPEEMALEFIVVYRTNRSTGPRSPYDLVAVYVEKQLEDAKSSEFVIQRLVSAIQAYQRAEETPFPDCDAFIFQNVIPFLPCSDGIKNFYIRNRQVITHLALHYPNLEEQNAIYADLGFDYRKQLTSSERKAVIRMIGQTALPAQNMMKLEER